MNIQGGWVVKQLGQILQYEQPNKYIVGSTNYSNKGLPVLTANKSFLLGYTEENGGICKTLPVIILDDFTLLSKFVDFPFKVKSSAMKILRVRDDGYNLKFVYWAMQLLPFHPGQHKRYYLSEYQFLDIKVPSIIEQQAVVSVIEKWDKYIEFLDQKIQTKKNIKKYLQQVLLTGKVRLRGFGGEWQEYILSELGKVYSGLKGKSKDDFGEGKKYIPYMNVYSNPRINLNINEFVNVKEGESQNAVKYGDVFFTTSSETPDEVAISSVLLDNNKDDIYLNSFCFGYRLNNFDILSPEFSQFYFRSSMFRKQMNRIAQGAIRYNLSKKYFLEERVTLPNIQEQKAISSILSKSDDEITILEKQKSIIKEQKKYLLNNLVTGEIRLPKFRNN